ncbi:MAG: hypothetical protein K0U47_11370 [Epsilonproteobacteria bacterium]|nr:hypothetical protein [Campylobacterota bacterium]
MNSKIIVSSLFVASLLMWSGCGSSSHTSATNNPDNNETVDPHPGETALEVKARYLADIKSTNVDLNLSNATINTNLTALVECLYSKDPSLKKDDIIATFGSGVREEDVNATSGIVCKNVTVRKVGGTFSNSLNVLYYSVDNPVTQNEQLLAYDYANKKAHVINTNVILGDRTFLFEGEKEGEYQKYTGRKFGIYLDPNQEFETRILQGTYGPSAYKFFSNNALMKFDVRNPKQVESFINSTHIPATAVGLTKLGDEYKVFENIVDSNNSYIALTAFDSLADVVAGESDDNKTQANITVRVSDKKAILGRPLVIEKNTDLTTAALFVSEAAPFKPMDGEGVYALKKYNPQLTSKTDIADGRFYYATQNNAYIYFYQEGSDKLQAIAKNGGTALTEVTGITLAGNYALEVHGQGAWHGNFTSVINGAASTLSGRNESLSKGADAYLAFHYDLHPEAVVNAFGTSGTYKSVQVFKLTGTSGVKMMDNADGVDQSMDAALDSESIKGHVNLIAVTDDKVYLELGWWDGNDTAVGGDCTDTYMSRGQAKRTCTHLKYGYLDTTVTDAVDITPLMVEGTPIEAKNLPYYVSRRICPVAVNDTLHISTFNGGSLRSGGYTYNRYSLPLNNETDISTGAGRIYMTKKGENHTGNYKGSIFAWDATISQIYNVENGTQLGDTSSINGSAQGSVSAQTDGIPLAGFGDLAMLKNNDANHAFTLFITDTVNTGTTYVDFAPYGGWIYE